VLDEVIAFHIIESIIALLSMSDSEYVFQRSIEYLSDNPLIEYS